MVGLSVEWEGIDEIIGAIDALKQTIDTQAVPAALQQGAQAVQRQSQQVCPVRTGYLRQSITIRPGIDQAEIEIAAQAAYAGYVEAGTSRMTGRRYMEQGMLSGLPEFVTAIEQQLADALRS